MSYAELLTASAFSFLEGASHPHDLVAQAAALHHEAIGIADLNTVAGVVRAHVASQKAGLRLLVGSRLQLSDAPDLVCYPEDRAAWGRLTRLLTKGKMHAPKGECQLNFSDVLEHASGQVFIVVPPAVLDDEFALWLRRAAAALRGQLYVAAMRRYAADDEARLYRLRDLAQTARLRLLAGNDVLYHVPQLRPLQDVLRCIRHGVRVEHAGTLLEPHGERHLKPPDEMARLFRKFPQAIAAQREILDRAKFSLDEISYEYPDEPVPPGLTPDQHLADLTWTGAQRHYGEDVPQKVRETLEKELRVIAELDYARYFLTVEDIVRYARGRGILCQGRGSAANSAICYMLDITAVDPTKIDLLFERFISAERKEPPDIDVDFEHERREEVIQYLYNRYGRHRAAIAATVIHYRPKSAIREVAKALGLSENVAAALATQSWSAGEKLWNADTLREAGIDPEEPAIAQAVALARELVGLPRHLSQHVGGFVLTRGRLDESVPIGNGAMKDRSFIEWDKDDIDALKMMKVDVLALGMLTCIRKAFALLGIEQLTEIPQDDPAVYDMLCKGDSLGVFQVESRAQMNMLPRLKPRKFYDLVVEVAIVRPGPIQGDMVHPYLQRRADPDKVVYPQRLGDDGNELKEILQTTLGVPLFQEQAMKIAMVAAEFSATEANGLRRAMATFRNVGTISEFGEKMIGRMVARGYEKQFAENCFKQIEGFGSYGFPESHAASFALLVYVSSWIKCHHPAAFAVALLNSQPMGFYAPAQIVRDAREHGVAVLDADVNASDWDCTLEDGAVRLGLRMIGGFQQDWWKTIAKHRGAGFADLACLAAAGLPRPALEHLAGADALRGIGLPRRLALWRIAGVEMAPAPLVTGRGFVTPDLPVMSQGEHVIADYRATGLSLRDHPCALLRHKFTAIGAVTCTAASAASNGARLRTAGIVTVRQRPGTAKGTIFMTIEDETGIANIVVWPSLVEPFRNQILGAALLIVKAKVQRGEEGVTHLIAEHLTDRTGWIAGLERDELSLTTRRCYFGEQLHGSGGSLRDSTSSHIALDAPLSHADEMPRPRPPGHPRQERVVRKSRDFH